MEGIRKMAKHRDGLWRDWSSDIYLVKGGRRQFYSSSIGETLIVDEYWSSENFSVWEKKRGAKVVIPMEVL